MSESTYRAHENGQNDFTLDEAKAYAKKFKVDPLWLIGAENLAPPPPMAEVSLYPLNTYQFSSPKIDSPNARVSSSISGHGVKIPVYGRAIGGIDGEFDMNGSLLGTILAPPKLAGMKDVYAVIVVGESMSPRYEDGETCVIDPHYRIKKGDYVVAQIKNEDEGPQLAYVKKFIRRNDIELVLEQFNPPKELHFPAKNVVSVHYISVSGNL